MTMAIPAQRLAVSPASAALGKFPSWESRAAAFTIRNTHTAPVSLLRVRSSFSRATRLQTAEGSVD